MDDGKYQEWIGRAQELEDTVDIAKVRGLAACLDIVDMDIREGSPLPCGWHWMFFNPLAPARELGEDGHPRRGGFLPPVELPRRMWAGGELEFLADLPVGGPARRVSTIVSVTPKKGRAGDMCFVTVKHETFSNGTLAINELQNIVYLQPPAPSAGDVRPAPAQADEFSADWSGEFSADEPLLFRYSALTGNAHRIHYDRPYATGMEGYPDLVVHGPLTATMLMRFASDGERKLRSFRYSGVGPLFIRQRAVMEGAWKTPGKEAALRVRKDDMSPVMKGSATF